MPKRPPLPEPPFPPQAYESDPPMWDDWELAQADQAKHVEKKQAEWKAKWPKHCAMCGGWGAHTFTQSHDRGPPETLVDACEALPFNVCHRCGEEGMDEGLNGNDTPCKACGWHYDDGVPEF